MVDFSNTQIAFESKANNDLNRSYFLFSIIGKPILVNIGSKLTNLALKLKLPIKSLIKATIFKQFVGGENIEECNKTIEGLGKYNVGSILDYSVEGKESEIEFDNCALETIATIKKATGNKNIPFCVFKVTGLASFELLEKVSAKISLSDPETTAWEKVKARVDQICKTAFEAKQALFIDAEESWIQEAINELAEENMERYNKESAIVYNTFQMYLKKSISVLNNSIEKAKSKNYFIGAKIVRGAYMEKETKRAKEKGYENPIHISKYNTDKDYDTAIVLSMLNINIMAICAGTHNEESCIHLINLMKKYNLQNNDDRIYFSQLLGMSDHISFNLSKGNYNVAKYVPYGPVNDTLPYLIRRAQENTSVKGQTGRELNLIIKERERRKTNHQKHF